MRLGCLPPHPRLLAQCWPHEPVCLGSLESREPADPWLRPPSLPSSRNPQNCRQHRDRDRDLHTAQQLVVAPMRSAHRLYSWSTRRGTQTLKGGEGPRPLKPMAGLGKNLVQVFATLRDLHWECLRLWTGFELPSSWTALPCYGLDLNRNVLGPVPGVDVMAKRSQGWVKCEDRLPYYRGSSCSLPLPRLHDHNSTTREDLAAGDQRISGSAEWRSWGFKAARGRCSGQLRSKTRTRASHLCTK
jgi:hypothetical protein